ncbi:MAG: YdcF family protein [Acidaminobacteraceae bacterium]
MKTTISLILIGSALVFTFTQVLIYSEAFNDSRQLNESELDYVIVLGAGLRGKDISSALKYHLDRVLDLDMDSNMYILVLGGQGADELITEARAMNDYLIENGIEKKRIILEEESTSTFENFKLTLRKLESEGFIVDDKINFAVVTNDFHIFRSKDILSKLGYDSIGIAAKISGVVKVDYFFREFYAVINTVLFDF